MSADEELGYVYLPVSTPTNDYYGGHRPGDDLYGESLVCLDATTGKQVWHFQLVHHGLWDYDLPTAPNLIDITVDGKPIKAVAQVTKQAFAYVFDRVTGQPVWPIEEQPVPASTVPGEQASPTQPFPTKPAPFDIQGATDDNLIDLTPEIHQEAIAIAKRYDRGSVFTPPSQRGTIQVPGDAGGASWSGAAVDPETPHALCADLSGADAGHHRQAPSWEGSYDFIGRPPMWTARAACRCSNLHLPASSPSTWIPASTAGGSRSAAASRCLLSRGSNLPGDYGVLSRSFALITKTVMIVVQMGALGPPRVIPGVYALIRDLHNRDPHLWVYDKTSGEKLAEIELPSNASGAPITYMAGGKQYIAFPVGGGPVPEELIAVGL